MIPAAIRRRQNSTYARRQLQPQGPTGAAAEQRSIQSWLRSRRATYAGTSVVPITEETAMQIGAVWCAVRIRAGIMSSLPMQVFERSDDGKDRKLGPKDHPVAALLNREPNEFHTPAVFKEQLETHVCLWGNHYAELDFDLGSGSPDRAMPVHPSQVEPFIDRKTRSLKYRVTDQDGIRILDRSQMIHVPHMTLDGISGVSVISHGAQAFGIAQGGDRLAATFMTNAAKPFLIVTHPDYLDDEPFNRLSSEIRNEYTGDKAFGSLLLEGGATANFATMPLRDAQFLETREFQGKEIAAQWFGLPPHLAGFLDQAHYQNVNEQDRALVTFTLGPLLVRSEQEWNRKAFYGEERDRLYIKYNVDALLRGQQKERYEAHRSALQAGWKTINEVRDTEELAPLPGGDELPKPQAIWGKPDPSTTDPAPASEPAARSADPRLAALVETTLRGLQGAEIVQAQRIATKPDSESRLREWYTGHELKTLDRLAGFDQTEVRKALNIHRDQLLRALSDPDPSAAVELCVSGWRNDPANLAQTLTNGDTHGD